MARLEESTRIVQHYAERRRYGERVSTGFVESAINTVVGKRFGKRQQIRWSKGGAHLMLQARTRTLDGTLRGKFEQWYPGLKAGDRSVEAEQRMPRSWASCPVHGSGGTLLTLANCLSTTVPITLSTIPVEAPDCHSGVGWPSVDHVAIYPHESGTAPHFLALSYTSVVRIQGAKSICIVYS